MTLKRPLGFRMPYLMTVVVFFVTTVILLLLSSGSTNAAFENNAASFSFSLAAYQKGRAQEISKSLDATRYHFQILFVDKDNAKARLAEGLLARVAEYNDALCVLFPASSTVLVSDNERHHKSSNNKAARRPRHPPPPPPPPPPPQDAAPLPGHLEICHSLGLDRFRSEEMGTAFDLNLLDQYDLIIAMDDDIRSLILRSISGDEQNQHYYAQKCRLLSEFLSFDFCGSIYSNSDNENDNDNTPNSNSNSQDSNELLLDMLESDLRQRVEPFVNVFQHRHNDDVFSNAEMPHNLQEADAVPRMIMNPQTGAAVLNTQQGSWPLVEAATILATAGLTRFCLDTMDAQLHDAFQTLLDRNIYLQEHLTLKWQPDVEDQLIRCNGSVCGYFSPQQRKAHFDRHVNKLKRQWEEQKQQQQQQQQQEEGEGLENTKNDKNNDNDGSE